MQMHEGAMLWVPQIGAVQQINYVARPESTAELLTDIMHAECRTCSTSLERHSCHAPVKALSHVVQIPQGITHLFNPVHSDSKVTLVLFLVLCILLNLHSVFVTVGASILTTRRALQ